jgi:hypothetical protein
MKESGLGGLVFPSRSSQATCTYWARHTHSARESVCSCSHFLRMCRSEDVGDCCRFGGFQSEIETILPRRFQEELGGRRISRLPRHDRR